MAAQQHQHQHQHPYQRPYEGKLGIVTGGSRGIGAAVARRLAAKGCNLLLVYTSDSSTAATRALGEELSAAHGVRTAALQADLLDGEAAAPRVVQAARELFSSYHDNDNDNDNDETKLQIDILINNAGVSSNQFLNDPDKGPIGAAEFDRVYRVNVLAPLLLMQAVAPYLPLPSSSSPSSSSSSSSSTHQQLGRVVNVSSVSSSIGYEGQSVYAGTKAAIEAMTRCWSRELAARATVNAVNPGPAWGDMYAEVGEKFWRINQPHVDAAPLAQFDGSGRGAEAAVRQLAGDDYDRFEVLVREKMRGRRPGFTGEIAGTIDMLCSEEAGWTTGSVVCANGGMKMSIA